jgi:hypothetical protein
MDRTSNQPMQGFGSGTDCLRQVILSSEKKLFGLLSRIVAENSLFNIAIIFNEHRRNTSNLLLLVPVVIGLVILVRWFQGRPIFTDRDGSFCWSVTDESFSLRKN